jgi:hypothetical protein
VGQGGNRGLLARVSTVCIMRPVSPIACDAMTLAFVCLEVQQQQQWLLPLEEISRTAEAWASGETEVCLQG